MAKLWMIYCADANWGIGKNNQLLVHIPEDLKDRFKALTLGHPVIMGRKTLESLPGGKGLPGRENIVLSRTMPKASEGLTVLRSVEEILCYAASLEKDAFVIGGGEIYRQLMPYCAGAYVTKVPEAFDADTFVENLDRCKGWKIVRQSDLMKSVTGVSYQYVDYINEEAADGQ